MSQRRLYLAPSGGLTIGSGIMNGVNQGIQNYMRMKQMKAHMELQHEQMRAQAAYREAQAQALKSRYGSQDVDMAKVGTALQMANHPGATPDQQSAGQKMAQKYLDQALTNANTPDQQAYIRSKISAYMGGQAPQGGAPGTQPGQVQPPPSTGFPDMPQSPGTQSWSYAERQMFSNALKPNAQVIDTGIKTQSDQQIKRIEGENQVRKSQMAYQQAMDLETKRGANGDTLAKIKGDFENQKAQIIGDYGLDKADITGKYRVQAAKAAAAGRVNNALSPDQKAGLQQVKSIDDQMKVLQGQLANPFKGLDNMTLTDDQKKAHVNALNQQLQGLQSQKQTLLDGYKLGPHYQAPGSSQGSPVSPGQGSSPSGPGPVQAPSFKQPGSGTQAPSRAPQILSAGDAAKAQPGDLMAHPNGFLYKVTGVQNGKPMVDSSNPIPSHPLVMAPQNQPAAPQAPAPGPTQIPISTPGSGGGLPPVPPGLQNPNLIPGQ